VSSFVVIGVVGCGLGIGVGGMLLSLAGRSGARAPLSIDDGLVNAATLALDVCVSYGFPIATTHPVHPSGCAIRARRSLTALTNPRLDISPT
jgi:hypothetical protein